VSARGATSLENGGWRGRRPWGPRSTYTSDATSSNLAPGIGRYELAPNRLPTTSQTAGDSLARSRSTRSGSQRAGYAKRCRAVSGKWCNGADRPVPNCGVVGRGWLLAEGEGGRPRRSLPRVGERGVGGAIVPSALASDATSSTVAPGTGTCRPPTRCPRSPGLPDCTEEKLKRPRRDLPREREEGQRRRRDLYRPSPRLGRYFPDRKTPGLRVSNSRRRNDSQPSVPHRPDAFTHCGRLGPNGKDLAQ
jgi:hypothetical protein